MVFGWLRKKKKEKEGEVRERWVLKRKGEKGGFEKVMDLPRMMTPDELYPSLAPGFYVVHKYEKGASGFTETGPVFEVLGEAPAAGSEAPRRVSPFAGLRQVAEDFKGMKEDIVFFAEVFAPMAGYSKAGGGVQKTVIEQLKEAKAELKDLQEIFPTSTTDKEKIPIEGKIPAWMVYTPQMVDTAMDGVEKRLIRWGLVESVTPGTGEVKELIMLPEKPKAAARKTEETSGAEETPASESIVLPEKPKGTDEVRTEEIGEEKKDKGGKKSVGKGKGTGKGS